MIRVYIGLAIAAVIAAAVAGAWFKGREYERDLQLTAQLRAAVTVTGRQRAATVREVIRYVDRIRYTERVLPHLRHDIVSRCLGLLPDGAQVQPGRDSAPVPVHGAGDPPAARAGRAGADEAWCQQLAADYAAGARNTDRLRFALGWADANGAAEP